MTQDRRQSDKDVGEIKGTLDMYIEESRSHRKAIHDKLENAETRLKKIEEELSIYKTVYKTVKFIALCIIAVATFKFGDVRNLWARVFGVS